MGIINKYEPYIAQDNDGVLEIISGYPKKYPFLFEIPIKNENDEVTDYIIQPDEKVVIVIKESFDLFRQVLKYEFTDVKENVVVLDITPDDVKLLRAGITYYLSAALIGSNGKLKYSLIRKLDIKVLPSAFI